MYLLKDIEVLLLNYFIGFFIFLFINTTSFAYCELTEIGKSNYLFLALNPCLDDPYSLCVEFQKDINSKAIQKLASYNCSNSICSSISKKFIYVWPISLTNGQSSYLAERSSGNVLIECRNNKF